MEKINKFRNSLDKKLNEKNAFNDTLGKVADKTKVSRINLVLGVSAFFILYLIFGYGGSFLATLVGFAFPAYKSIKALESTNKEDDTQWLTYWVVFAFVSVVEAFTDIFFYWIPLYSLMKCIFFVFMMLPMEPNGSLILYRQVIRPYMLAHQKTIDEAVDQLEDLGGKFVKKGATVLASQVKQD